MTYFAAHETVASPHPRGPPGVLSLRRKQRGFRPRSCPRGGKLSSPTLRADVEPNFEDQKIAETALLQLSDFPAGWEAQPAKDEDDDDDEGKKEIATCVGVPYDQLYDDSNATANSPDFTSPDDVEISNTVGVAGDETWLAEAFEVTSRPEYRNCMAKSMQKVMEDGAEDEDLELGEVTVNELSFEQHGDESVAFRVTMPIESSGFSFEYVGDFVIVRIGRGQVVTTAFSLGGTVDAEDLNGYVQLGVSRLQDAL
ncbi:hypothetical protein [Nocardioides alcanivorans]|uniref:hypothetical protein n=1 Tax=Nocardioides alcanivorans TaxID=2897352 RepID=UPI001F477F84|nr:hypothetical protein [Nocardioides alcanivorans]